MNTNVLRAVFTRNFVAYFANPTGYVFICLFVLLSSIAAFWPNDFFNSNLANLDQLNKWFPFIMLVFIPAITMSIWADERRQGTDELLLTIPASDLDIVLGKYLAAVAIYSVSLLFSLVTNLSVLAWLGDPDVGLFLGTYIGYWLVGLAMLAVGMVASFLTGNLTVGFVLGAVFNLPLVFTAKADAILAPGTARAVGQWSVSEQFRDFGRGIVSLSSLAYFATIVVAMLYLSMVLIARRHWVRGRDWSAMASHYGLRTLALVITGVGLTVFFHFHDLRGDVTSEQLSSLSPHTLGLLKQLQQDYRDGKIKQPVRIEAFISREVPDSYVQARLNLISVLRELDARGGDLVRVQINDTERFTDLAVTAEDYGITPRRVFSMSQGTYSEAHVFMGVAFSCGVEDEVLKFIDRGIPAEYELVRSLCTVTQQKRKRIGVLQTDAQLFGSFNMQTMSPGSDWPIIDELKKQYEVVRVNPSEPIPLRKPGGGKDPGNQDPDQPGDGGENAEEEGFDVLLAVQPSAMGEAEVKNFLEAVRQGQPTAIFEDPCTFLVSFVPATTQPRRPPPQMQMMRSGPMPKGDIKPLWRMLGVNFSGDDGSPGMGFGDDRNAANRIVWQSYNPYPKVRMFDRDKEFVFVDGGCGSSEPFNQEQEITSKLQQVLFPAPGFIRQVHAATTVVQPLVRTGTNSGYVPLDKMWVTTFFGPPVPNPYRPLYQENEEYILAARITGRAKAESSTDDSNEPQESSNLNVVLVADLDMLSEPFFRLREQGDVPGGGAGFEFDNVTFVLNVLDFLAGDPRLLDLRKRRPKHRTLKLIEEATRGARKETDQKREQHEKDYQDAIKKAEDQLEAAVKKLEDRLKQSKEKIDPFEVQQRVDIERKDRQQQLDVWKEEREQERDDKIEQINNKLAADKRRVQHWYKMCAVLLPPIPPLLVAVVVFFTRRAREREGVSRAPKR